jgi:hypothetical protein
MIKIVAAIALTCASISMRNQYDKLEGRCKEAARYRQFSFLDHCVTTLELNKLVWI